jgi:hypothetical protein
VRDSELEWFRPLWLRLLVTGLVVVWFCWETFVNHDQTWMLITGAALAYAVWNLFITYKAPPAKPKPGEAGASPPAAKTDDDGKPEA